MPKRTHRAATSASSAATTRPERVAREASLDRIAALGVAAVATLFYAPTLDHRLTRSDDTVLLVDDRPFLESAGALGGVFERTFFPASGRGEPYYRPLVTASFVLDARRASGPEDAGPFHTTNVVLHALGCALVFTLGRRLGVSRAGAAAAAAILALHPAATSTVAWIPGRCDSFLLVLGAVALHGWLSWDERRSRPWLAVHAVALGLALFVKESALAIPVIAASWSWLRGERLAVLSIHTAGAWIAPIGLWFVLRSRVIAELPPELVVSDPGAKIATAFAHAHALLAAYGKMTAPVEPEVLSTLADTAWWLGIPAIAALGFVAWRLSGPERRRFIWGAFVVPLSVLLPSLPVSDFLILENRLYLPLAALLLALAGAADAVVRARPDLRAPIALGAGLAALVLGVVSFRYAGAFEGPRPFAENAVRTSPTLALAHLNLGVIDYLERDVEGAERSFRRAAELDDDQPVVHNNLGLIHLDRNELSEAERHFRRELEIAPRYAKAHFNLGLVLARTGRDEEARDHFERTIALVPTDTDAMGQLLRYWAMRGDDARATEYQRRMEELGVEFFTP